MSSLKCETRHSHVIAGQWQLKTCKKPAECAGLLFCLFNLLHFWSSRCCHHHAIWNSQCYPPHTSQVSGKLNLITGKYLVLPIYWYLFKHEIFQVFMVWNTIPLTLCSRSIQFLLDVAMLSLHKYNELRILANLIGKGLWLTVAFSK